MLRYLRTFNFLWRAKRMEHSLASVWKAQASHNRHVHKMTGLNHVTSGFLVKVDTVMNDWCRDGTCFIPVSSVDSLHDALYTSNAILHNI